MNAPVHPECPRHCGPLALDEANGAWRCVECGGALVQADKLAHVHPVLARLAIERDQALAAPTHGVGIPACPSSGCGAPAHPLSFFEVPLDWCLKCGSIWFDGGEIEQLRTKVRALMGAGDRQASPYRGSVAEALVLGTVVCAACSARVPVNTTYVTANGVCCASCAEQAEGILPSRESAAEVDAYLARRTHQETGWSRQLAAEFEQAERERGETPAQARTGFFESVLSAVRRALGVDASR